MKCLNGFQKACAVRAFAAIGLVTVLVAWLDQDFGDGRVITRLESLDENWFVFVCCRECKKTTDINSRRIVRIHIHNLYLYLYIERER